MIEIFGLYLITSSNIIEVGRFPTEQACAAVRGSEKMFCKSQYVSNENPVFGMCWDCLRGCYRKDNGAKCHVDPLPQ